MIIPRISFMKKQTYFGLLMLVATSLMSCGSGSDGSLDTGGYTIEPAEVGDNVVRFADAFNESKWVVVDKNNSQVAPVKASMVSDFDSTQKSFGKDLTAHVIYDNKTLPLVYQISKYYDAGDYAVNLLDSGAVDLTSLSNASNIQTYDVPATLSLLPEPAKSWPVTSLSVIFSDNLTQLKLNKTLTHVASSLGRYTRVIPAEGGTLNYRDGYLVDNESADLLAISSSLGSTITLPTSMKALLPCAFAQTNVTITGLHLPANVTSVGESGITAFNFPNLAKFVVDEGSTTLEDDASGNGVVRSLTGAGTATVLVPPALKADPLVFNDTAPYVHLNCLYKHSGVTSISLPATTLGFSTFMDLKASLTTITLLHTGEKPVSVSASTLANLSSSIAIKVPSEMLSLYKADTIWATIANNITAI
jgi:hypothetical protein